jgi:hypothetical protein
MSPIFKNILNITIWILFIKGIVLVPITLYTTYQAYLTDGTMSLVGLASCATGTFAFTMACFIIWIKHKVE